MKLLSTVNLLITVESLKYKKSSSYCLKCRKKMESINSKVLKTSNDKIMILSKYAKIKI